MGNLPTYESGYDKNAFAHNPPYMKTVPTIATASALPSELISDEFRGKDTRFAPGNSHPQTTPADSDGSFTGRGKDNYVDLNEEDWALDEIVTSDEEVSEGLYELNTTSGSSLPEPQTITLRKLPFPVIIPQRRPRTKSRGFVRAYAPVLEESGIDQETFLKFLRNFNSAVQASPIIQIVKLASEAVSLYPNTITAAVSLAAQVTATVAGDIQGRRQGNKSLYDANRKLFGPRGLYALIVAYECAPNQKVKMGSEEVDVSTKAIAKYPIKNLVQDTQTHQPGEGTYSELAQSSEKWKEKANQLRVSSGRTAGEAEMPVECAPLIFPGLDDAAADTYAAQLKEGDKTRMLSTSKITSKVQSASNWMADYFDRRAQAAFARKNPDSTLVKLVPELQVDQPQETERQWEKAQKKEARKERKEAKKEAKDIEKLHKHQMKREARSLTEKGREEEAKRETKSLEKSLKKGDKREEKEAKKEAKREAKALKEKPRKRLLTEDVLYLMVVNMPNEQELDDARRDLKDEREGTDGEYRGLKN